MKLVGSCCIVLLTCVVLVGLTAPAQADLPDLPLDTLLAGVCTEARAQASCPDCACEPYTQAYSADTFDDDEPMQHGLAVHLEGKSSKGERVKRYVAAFGNPSQFTYGGVLADYSGGERALMTATVSGVKRLMDMCPGACEHDPVGIVHIFEVTRTVKSLSEDPMAWDTTDSELAVCFERDKVPTCWSVPLSSETVGSTVATSPKESPKVKVRNKWKRKWSLGHDVYGAPRLVLAKGTGSGDHGMREDAVFKKGGTFYFHQLPGAAGVSQLGR